MSGRKTILLKLRSPESAMSLHHHLKRLARRSIRMILFPCLSVFHKLTASKADRLAYLEEKVNLILSGKG